MCIWRPFRPFSTSCVAMMRNLCRQIRNILKQGIETPEDQNDLRKMQLRELARLNGTLREDDNRWVQQVWQQRSFSVGVSLVMGMMKEGKLQRKAFVPFLNSSVESETDCVCVCRILRPWQNTEPRSITNTTLCTKCGGAGHISSDCKYTRWWPLSSFTQVSFVRSLL